jgi:hypothetical protein
MTAPDGSRLTPVSNDLMLRSTEQRLASASAQDRPDASRRREFVLSHPGDRLYDLKCQNGHQTLSTAPQITKAIRRTPGNSVTLARPLLTEV